MHKSDLRKSSLDTMDNFISRISASSLVSSSAQPVLQIQTQLPISMPETAVNSEYGYLPGDIWHTMDYYDVTMGVSADVLGVSKEECIMSIILTKVYFRQHRRQRHLCRMQPLSRK